MTNKSNILPFIYSLLIIAVASFNCSYSKSTFSGDRVKDAIEKIVIQKSMNKAQLDFISVPRTIEFEEPNVEADIIVPDEIKAGINNVSVKYTINGKLLKYIDYNIRVKLLKDVWVAANKIAANSVISMNDLTLREIVVFNDVNFPSENELVGRTANRSINKDDVLKVEMIAPDVKVKRGDKVTVVVVSGAVVIRCSGTTLQEGVVGDMIRVKRDGSQNVVSGKIASDGSVVINSGNITYNQKNKK